MNRADKTTAANIDAVTRLLKKAGSHHSYDPEADAHMTQGTYPEKLPRHPYPGSGPARLRHCRAMPENAGKPFGKSAERHPGSGPGCFKTHGS
ncbi:MAG: hypothetical protein R2875_02585 [Desulfobacterales bacterium]